MTVNVCDKCKTFGLQFERRYSPEDMFEGKRSSRIWIVGLNPKGLTTTQDQREIAEMEAYFNNTDKIHPYFRDFKTISDGLFSQLGKERGVGHTDLVKCYSESFPPSNNRKDAQQIVSNCKQYFNKQLAASCPELLICNGAPVCNYFRQVIPAVDDHETDSRETYYWGRFDGKRVAVVLSGFVGRIDNFAKWRLGKEIEQLARELGIDLSPT
jgi:uracil-DNA glycosylase